MSAEKEAKKESSAVDEVMEVKKVKLGWKVQLGFAIFTVLLIITLVYLFAPANPNDSNGVRGITSQNLDYGILTATVGGTTMDVDPDAYITVEPLDAGVAWERIVNGIVVKRYRTDGTPDPAITPRPVGRRDTVIYRVIEGQAVGTMRFAYVKHRNEKPPLGWFAAAKKLL